MPRVAVAGASGWAGSAVVVKLEQCGHTVYRLQRSISSSASSQSISSNNNSVREQPTASSRASGSSPSLHVDLCMDGWQASLPPLDCIISCIGLKDWGATDTQVHELYEHGAMRLYEAAEASGAVQLIMLTGMRPRDSQGKPLKGSVVQQAREAGLQAILARASQSSAISKGNPVSADTTKSRPAVTVIEATMFFKDVDGMYSRLLASGSAFLVSKEAYSMAVNPISACDLASRIESAVLLPDQYNMRVTVGGPETVTYEALYRKMAAVSGLGEDALRMRAIPAWLASVLALIAACLAAITRARILRKIARVLRLLIAICSQHARGGVVGTPYGKDAVMPYVESLGVRLGMKSKTGNAVQLDREQHGRVLQAK